MGKNIDIACHSNDENKEGSNQNPSGRNTPDPSFVDRPETMLSRLALRLRIIDVITGGLGQLIFAWANIMVLGGFTSDLPLIDFWFVTAILFLEGTNLLAGIIKFQKQSKPPTRLDKTLPRRHIQSDSSILSLLVGFFMQADFISSPHIVPYQIWKLDEGTVFSKTKRTKLPTDNSLLPHSDRRIVRKTNGLLYFLQFFIASSCAALSLTRLLQDDYEHASNNDISALKFFFSLMIGAALMFFFELGYWICEIKVLKLFTRVGKEYEFGSMSMRFLTRFFENAYSKCREGRNLEVSRMNLFSFAEELLNSDSGEEQIIGAMILGQLVQQKKQFVDGTLNRIGNSTLVLERLIEMLKSEELEEKIIQRAALEILSRVALDEQGVLLLKTIPGAMELIASLGHSGGGSTDGRHYESLLIQVKD